MVTRSTLDPIEEARAQVRMRYMRARRPHPGMMQIGLPANRLTRKKGGAKMPAIQMLQTRWKQIVGDKLFKYCRPEKIQGGREGRVLVLKVLPQAAPIVQHQVEEIRQRVSVAAGGDIVSVKLIQGQLSSTATPESARRRFNALTPKVRKQLNDATIGIEDKNLRNALISLGAAVLTLED